MFLGLVRILTEYLTNWSTSISVGHKLIARPSRPHTNPSSLSSLSPHGSLDIYLSFKHTLFMTIECTTSKQYTTFSFSHVFVYLAQMVPCNMPPSPVAATRLYPAACAAWHELIWSTRLRCIHYTLGILLCLALATPSSPPLCRHLSRLHSPPVSPEASFTTAHRRSPQTLNPLTLTRNLHLYSFSMINLVDGWISKISTEWWGATLNKII